MTGKVLPRYPIYIPSKGRFKGALTPRFLIKDKVPFYLVVEPQEADLYAHYANAPECTVLVLDQTGGGSSIYARNWIKDHATAAGFERHWQLDDNIRFIRRLTKGMRIPCASGVAFRSTEDFVDRYTNVAVAGLNYVMFAITTNPMPPFYLNVHVYSCTLVLNSIPHRWRLRYNEDTDLCLQVLSDGWCTVLINAFLAEKMRTMTVKGGNTEGLYAGDGRAVMARTLERVWPGVVETKRRFQRPQHVIKDQWRKFDTPLIRKPGFELPTEPNNYGLKLHVVRDIKSARVRKMLDDE